METIRGSVDRIVYTNMETGFTVLRMLNEDTGEAFTATGVFPPVSPGAEFSLEGEYRESRYGRQFQVSGITEQVPATLKGIEKYLGSGLIEGIGAVYAARITETFGMDTIRVIEEEPERLLEIGGIGKRKLEKITAAWKKQKEIRNVMIFLQGYGVSPAYGVKIYRTYGNDSIRLVKANPYRLIEDVWGIGFKLADNLARNMGLSQDSPARIQAGIRFILDEMSRAGHCYATFEELIHGAAAILEVGPETVEGEVRSLARENKIVEDGEDIFYLPWLHSCEEGIRQRLTEMESVVPLRPATDELALVEEISRTAGILYDDIQLAAIRMSLSARIMVLTGGPGTGKTTTVMGIIRALTAQNRSLMLAAPTGRAAKRLTETTGREALTIHRLLEYSPAEGFKKNQDSPLECDTLILDEASMIDLPLMYSVLRALPDTGSLILVGDVDQLPSVGPGNVLADFIDSGVVDVVRLNRIFRQAGESRIVANAHRINQGQLPEADNREGSDFFLVEESDRDRILTLIRDLVVRRLPERYPIDPLTDIQVLSPMQKGELGARNLNRILQEALNPEPKRLVFGQTEFRKNDRVMQLRNNYEKKVFNGDIGRVVDLDPDTRQMLVEFDGAELVYDMGDMDELTLAYAATVHKSQGSEYPVVIAPLTMSHYMMLQKNLLYTCVTRAKKLMILIGENRALRRAVASRSVRKRNTRLAERLRGMLD